MAASLPAVGPARRTDLAPSDVAASDVAASDPAPSDPAASGVAPLDPAAVVDRYIAVVSDLTAEPAALEALVHADARFVEHPNLIAPTGRWRDAPAAHAAREHSRSLLSGHRFDVHEHIVAGDRVVTRATWTGTLAIDAGPLPAGSELSAECCMVFTVCDGQILRQENYDCYAPYAKA